MTLKQTWVGLLSGAVVAAGIMTAATGCKMLKKGETEETAADTAAAEPEPPPEPEPTAEATATTEATAEAGDDAGADGGDELGDDEVKTYPQQIPASGTYVLLKSFNVHQAADFESKRLGGVGRGTIIRLKATLGEWMLIEWPAAPGEMKPGWIKVRLAQHNYIQKSEQEPDAGKPPVQKDAGKSSNRGRPFFYQKTPAGKKPIPKPNK